MKKPLLIPFFLLLTFNFLPAGSIAQTGFERVYGGLNDACSSIQLTHDNGFVLGGSTFSIPSRPNGYNGYGYVLRLNEHGDSLWSRYYLDQYIYSSAGVAELLTNQFAFPGSGANWSMPNGYAAAVRLLDTAGFIAGRTDYPEYNDAWSTSGGWLMSNRDSGYAFTFYTDGYTADNYYQIAVSGKTYNWIAFLGGEGVGFPYYIGNNFISQNSAGDYYAIVNYGDVFDTSATHGILLKKWSESGTLLLDSLYLGFNAQSIYATADRGLLLCGTDSIRLLLIDSTGTVGWDSTYNMLPYNNPVQAIQTRDLGYALLARSGPIALDTNDISLLKFDNAGNLLWERNFGGTGSEDPYEFRETSDGGFVILGHTNSFGAKHIYVIKTDSLGFISQNYFISSASSVYCVGDTAYLSVQPAWSYRWSTGDTVQSIAVTQSGAYRVTVNDGTGNPVTTAYYAVYFNPVPLAQLNLDSVSGICQGSYLLNTLTNYPGLQYDWYLNDTLLSVHGPQYSPALPGDYKLIVSNNCGIAADSVMINAIYSLPPVPVVSPSYSQICQGDSILLTTSYDSIYTGQWFYAPQYPYAYTPVPSAQDTVLWAKDQGYYQIQISDSNGCANLSAYGVQVYFYQRPEITYANNPDTALCPNDSVELYVCCGSSYLWNTGETTSFIWARNPGNYYATSTNASTCMLASDTFQLAATAALPISLGNDTSVCGGTSLALTAGPYYDLYRWNNGSTDDTLVVSASGTYSVYIELEYYSCPGRDTIRVRFGNIPPVNLGPDTTICNTHTTTLDAGAGFASYLWNDSSATQTLLASTTNTGIDTAWYFVTVTDTNGCSNRDSIRIVFNICSGMEQVMYGDDASIYPNPASREIHVSIGMTRFPVSIDFELIDAMGRMVKHITLRQPEQEIFLNDLPAGIYHYNLISRNKNLNSGQLVIE